MQVKSRGKCVLSKAERAKLESAAGIIEQLAFHYRDTDYGTEALEVGCFLQATLNNKEMFAGAEDDDGRE